MFWGHECRPLFLIRVELQPIFSLELIVKVFIQLQKLTKSTQKISRQKFDLRQKSEITDQGSQFWGLSR